jgi:hypothetical protein
VAWFLKKKHWSVIPGQNRLKPLRVEPLHWETVDEDFLEIFEIWMPLENFRNTEWIWRQ